MPDERHTVVAGGRSGRQLELRREGTEIVEGDLDLGDLLVLGVLDLQRVALGRSREFVRRVILGPDHALEMDGLPWPVYRAVRVQMCLDRRPVVIPRRGAEAPVHRAPVPLGGCDAVPAVLRDAHERAVGDAPRRPGGSVQEPDQPAGIRGLDRVIKAVRIRGRGADFHARQRLAGVVVERPHEQLAERQLGDDRRVDDAEGEDHVGIQLLGPGGQHVGAPREGFAVAEPGRVQPRLVAQRRRDRLLPLADERAVLGDVLVVVIDVAASQEPFLSPVGEPVQAEPRRLDPGSVEVQHLWPARGVGRVAGRHGQTERRGAGGRGERERVGW